MIYRSNMASVVSLGRSDLYESDVALLEGPHWLNDSVINFCCDYLAEADAGAGGGCVFVYPGTCFILALEEEDDDFADTLRGSGATAPGCRLAFFPVSDKVEVGVPGGTHWSMLVFDAGARRFFHLDSAGNSNAAAARRLAARLWPFMCPGAGALLLDAPRVPQQPNSHDCGVYAVMFAGELAAALRDGAGGPGSDAAAARLRERASDAAAMRRQILAWVAEVRARRRA